MAEVGVEALPPPPRRAPGLRGFLNDRKVRGWISQAALLLFLAALLAFFVLNASRNMTQAGIASGFGFLSAASGIDVNFKLIEFGPSSTYARLLLVGVLNTALVSAIGIVLATFLGFAIGIGRLSQNPLLSGLCGGFIELVRNIPLLLFVFFWYFGIVSALPAPRGSLNLADSFFLNNRGLYLPTPQAPEAFWVVLAAFALGIAVFWIVQRWAAARQARTGHSFPVLETGIALILGLPLLAALGATLAVGWEKPVLRGLNVRGGTSVTPEFVALLAALTTYTAGFIAEIVRAGILSVPDGQRQAAAALGLRRGEILRLIVLPQALRVIVPPLTSQYLNLLKNSSFAAAIAYPDIISVFVGSTLNQTGQAIEIIAITLAIYLAMSLAVSALMNWYNAKTALVTR
jgi:general L-amino acid transport system permease protein